MALPGNVGICEVNGTFIRGVADGSDPDRDPDGVPVVGMQIMFTPDLKPAIVKNETGGVTIILDPVPATTDENGVLIGPDGEPGVRLIASDDPDLNPNGWTWRATLSGAGIPSVQTSFVAPAGGTVDFESIVPVPANPGNQIPQWQAVVTTVTDAKSEAVAAKLEAVEAAASVQRDQPNGVAPLDGSAKVPDANLPERLSVAGLSTTIGKSAVTNGSPMTSAPREVVITGHSLAYSQDTSASGVNPPINGAPQTRSSILLDASFSDGVDATSANPITVVLQAFPGDRTSEAITRWAGGTSGDVEIFWIDTNDGRNYAGHPGGPLTDGATATNMVTLAERARKRGAPFIVIGGAPTSGVVDSRAVFARAQTERQVAERLGARFVDVGELMRDLELPDDVYWTDAVHLRPEVNSLVGARLSALFGPKGINPPRVSPGQCLTWRDYLHVGGNVVASPGAGVADYVIRLAEGEAATWSVDVTTPVVPVFLVEITGNATVSAHTNLDVNRAPRSYPLQRVGTGRQYVRLAGPPIKSPGPAWVSLRADAGSVDVSQVEFLPVDVHTGDATNPATYATLMPAGGTSPVRTGDSFWSFTVEKDKCVALTSDAQFLFDVRLGMTTSGVLLEQSRSANLLPKAAFMVFRDAANLIVRRYDGGAIDTTVADVFPASGIVAASIELVYTANINQMKVYVDGILRSTIENYPWKLAAPGLMTSNATAGVPFAAGTVAIHGAG